MAKASPSRRERRGGVLRRKVGIRVPKRTVLVLCEGERTEPDYLRALKLEPVIREKAAVDIKIEPSGAVPLTLVRRAAEVRARNPRDQGAVDEVWCLFDVEWPRNHPNLREAQELAAKNDVRLAISNPCFELWLVLHFADHTAWLDSDDAERLRSQRDRSTGKRLDGTLYMPRRTDAARCARSLAARHERDGTTFPDDNPSSGMYLFLEAIEAQ